MTLRWWQYLICFGLIIASIFAGISLWQTYTAESQVIGYVKHNTVETVEVISVSIDNLVFYETDTSGVYSFEDELPKKDFDGTKNNYEIKFNNYPCTINEYKAGYINSTTVLYFYELDGSLGSEVELTISFEFYSTRTLFEITAKSNLAGMSNLNQLIESEGVNIQVVYSIYNPAIEFIKGEN